MQTVKLTTKLKRFSQRSARGLTALVRYCWWVLTMEFHRAGLRVWRYSKRGALVASLVLFLILVLGSGSYALFFGSGQQSSDVNLDSGLAGWWKLDGNANDSSGNGNNGTVHGATPAADRFGNANSSYSFNGTSDYIEVPDSPTLRVGDPSFTYVAWVNPSSLSSCGSVGAAVCEIINKENSIELAVTSGGNVEYAVNMSYPISWSWINTGIVVPAGSWSQVVLSYDGSHITAYFNGSQVYSGAMSGNINNTNYQSVVRIGDRLSAAGFWPGDIDDVRMYNRAINSDEVGALYAMLGSSINLQKGLVGYWNFNGNAKDQTPYRNDGTVTGATLTTDRKGKANSAMNFNGSSNYISVPNSSSLDTAPDVTVSMWFKVTSATTAYQKLIGKGPDGTEEYGLYVTPNSGLLHVEYDSGTAHPRLDSSASVTDNQWHLATTTYDGTTLRLFLDGVQIGSTTVAGAFAANTENVSIGAEKSSSTSRYFLNGSLDDARVYNRALSTTEVSALYNQYDPGVNVDAGQSGLVGEWKMDGNANDSTPNRDNASMGSGVTAGTDREGKSTSALNFDGTANAYAALGSPAALNSGSGLSISGWVKFNPAGMGVYQVLISKGADSAFELNKSSDNCLRVELYTGAYYRAQEATCSLTNANTWYYVTATYSVSSGAIKLYVNGVSGSVSLVDSVHAGPTNTAGNVYIGARSAGSLDLNGSLDDLRVYNRVLSDQEVANIYGSYNSQVSVSSLQKGLVGDWAFNGSAKDSTPYRDNGTVNGATLTTDRKGRPNSAYIFNGASGESISVTTAGPYESFGTNSFTLASWVKTTESTAQRCIFSTASGAKGFRFGYSGGEPYYLVGDGTSYREGDIGTTALNDGNWHMLAIVYSYNSGWSVTAYIDGVNTGTVVLPTNIGSANGNPFGSIGNLNGGIPSLTGSVDDVKIWNRALSPAEISALYNEYQ